MSQYSRCLFSYTALTCQTENDAISGTMNNFTCHFKYNLLLNQVPVFLIGSISNRDRKLILQLLNCREESRSKLHIISISQTPVTAAEGVIAGYPSACKSSFFLPWRQAFIKWVFQKPRCLQIPTLMLSLRKKKCTFHYRMPI